MKQGQLQQHLDLIYATIDCQENWQACLKHIAQDINASSGMIGVDDLKTGNHIQRIQLGYDNEFLLQLEKGLKNEDIWTQALIKRPQVGFVTSEALVPHKMLINSKIYQEALRRFDIEHTIGAYALTEGRLGTRIAFQRNITAGEYSKDEQRYLNLLLPHIKRTLQLSKQLAHASGSTNQQRAPQSYRIICTRKAKLLYATPALEHDFSTLPLAPCFARKQVEIMGLSQRELSSTLASVCREEGLSALSVPKCYEVQYQGRHFIISIDRIVLNEALRQQLDEYQAPLGEHHEPLALVTISPTANTQSLSILTLTPREQSLCRYIAKGMSPREIAKLEHRSEQTVSSQIKAIRQKLGFTTYTALVAQLSRANHLAASSVLE